MKIEQTSPSTVSKSWSEAEPEVQRAATLEEAAQALVKTLQRRFEESVVIARMFITVPFGQLPDANQQFVRGLAKSAGVIVVFCRDTFSRAVGERFLGLATLFTTQTAGLVEPAKVFATPA